MWAAGALLALPRPAPAQAPRLRICADPNNMPFSNRALQGFENRIGALVAHDLGAVPTYFWWAQRRGFLRNTLRAGQCDIVIGIARGTEGVAATPPYYRSTYVFVTRRDRHLDVTSFDDARLRRLRIGLHVIGADYNSLPPGVALAARGLAPNAVGYSIYGNYADPDPPARLVQAVAQGEVDVAVVWGPLAGYFARRSPVPLSVVPVADADAVRGIPFAYDIVAAVRPGHRVLRDRVAGILRRRQAEIDRILKDYGVPIAAPSPVVPPDPQGPEQSATPCSSRPRGYACA